MLPPIYSDLSYPISDIFACSFTTIPFNSPLLTAAVFTLQENHFDTTPDTKFTRFGKNI